MSRYTVQIANMLPVPLVLGPLSFMPSEVKRISKYDYDRLFNPEQIDAAIDEGKIVVSSDEPNPQDGGNGDPGNGGEAAWRGAVATLSRDEEWNTVVLDLSEADYFTYDISGQTFSNIVNCPNLGHTFAIYVRQDETGGHDMFFDGNVRFLTETTEIAKDPYAETLITLMTFDQGDYNWLAVMKHVVSGGGGV